MMAVTHTNHGLHWHRGGRDAVLGFGYAGGNSRVLQPLAEHLPAYYGLAEVVLPGRGLRFREPCQTTVGQICGDVIEQLDQWTSAPILFGYSLGALLAYETACRLQAAGTRARALVVCALDAPHRLPPSRGVHRFGMAQLRTHLARLGATPPEVLADLTTLACFAPPILADYELIETYRFKPSAALACPIIVLAGRQDDHTSAAGVRAWQELGAQEFHELWVDAGHFFMDSHASTWKQSFELATASCGTNRPDYSHAQSET